MTSYSFNELEQEVQKEINRLENLKNQTIIIAHTPNPKEISISPFNLKNYFLKKGITNIQVISKKKILRGVKFVIKGSDDEIRKIEDEFNENGTTFVKQLSIREEKHYPYNYKINFRQGFNPTLALKYLNDLLKSETAYLIKGCHDVIFRTYSNAFKVGFDIELTIFNGSDSGDQSAFKWKRIPISTFNQKKKDKKVRKRRWNPKKNQYSQKTKSATVLDLQREENDNISLSQREEVESPLSLQRKELLNDPLINKNLIQLPNKSPGKSHHQQKMDSYKTPTKSPKRSKKRKMGDRSPVSQSNLKEKERQKKRIPIHNSDSPFTLEHIQEITSNGKTDFKVLISTPSQGYDLFLISEASKDQLDKIIYTVESNPKFHGFIEPLRRIYNAMELNLTQ